MQKDSFEGVVLQGPRGGSFRGVWVTSKDKNVREKALY